jgi:PD-(D/E)XK endonuclease
VIRTIKRVAARLDLDSSHFTGQRRWSDLQLRDAVPRATTWAELLRLLGVHDDSTGRSSVKAHAIRLRLDTSHLQAATPEPALDPGMTQVELSMLSAAAGSIAMAWFTLRGMSVAVPAEPEVYDLLVTIDGRIQRVQVKSTTCQTKTGRWEVGVGRRPYVLDKSAGKTPYDPELIDYFFVVAGDGRLFLIPSLVLAGRVRVYVDTYARYLVGDAASLLR